MDYMLSVYNNIDNPLETHKCETADQCFIKRITEHAKTIYKLLKENKLITDIDLKGYIIKQKLVIFVKTYFLNKI